MELYPCFLLNETVRAFSLGGLRFMRRGERNRLRQHGLKLYAA